MKKFFERLHIKSESFLNHLNHPLHLIVSSIQPHDTSTKEMMNPGWPSPPHQPHSHHTHHTHHTHHHHHHQRPLHPLPPRSSWVSSHKTSTTDDMERYAFSSDSPRDTTRMIPSHFAHVPLPSRPRPLRIPTPLQIPPLKNQKRKKENNNIYVRSRKFMFQNDKQKLM